MRRELVLKLGEDVVFRGIILENCIVRYAFSDTLFIGYLRFNIQVFFSKLFDRGYWYNKSIICFHMVNLNCLLETSPLYTIIYTFV